MNSSQPSPEAEGNLLVASPIVVKEKENRGKGYGLYRVVIYSILVTLLYLALRNAPLAEIWRALSQLELWQIVVLVIINIIIYMLVTLRWWIVIHAGQKSIPYFPLVLVRVAVFGVSYFTLGPQVGGEPLQVLYLQRKYGMTYTRAASTVIMDKLLEFLANFFLLVFGLMAVLRAGILSANGNQPLGSLTGAAALGILLAWPPIHIMLMIRGIYPLGVVLRYAASRFGNPKWARFLIAAERMAGRFCQRNPDALWKAAGVPGSSARRAGHAGSQPGIHARRFRDLGCTGDRRDTFDPCARSAGRRSGFTLCKPRPGKTKRNAASLIIRIL